MPLEHREWIEQLEVEPGDHVIAVLTDEDDLSLLSPYAANGLRRGNLSSVVATADKHDVLRQRLTGEGIDVDRVLDQGDLVFVEPSLLTGGGELDVEQFLARIVEFVDGAAAAGVEHVQNCGAMDWLLNTVENIDDAIYLEARLNEIYRDRPVSGF